MSSSSRVASLARGNWAVLLPALGVDRKFLVNRHGPCPICGGDDRFRWDNQGGNGGFICNQCGGGDGFDLAMKSTGKSFRSIAEDIHRLLGVSDDGPDKDKLDQAAVEREAMRSVWSKSRPIRHNSAVGLYLARRAGVIWSSTQLLEHPGLPVSGQLYPAMVAKVVSHDDRAVNLHRTFIGPNGEKAPVEKPKMVMPGQLPDGCAIRLSEALPIMGVAEGIESAISASIIHQMPVWACLNGTLLAKWKPPRIAKEVCIFGDNDENYTGQAKAYALANRLEVQFKVRAKVVLPPQMGMDWNDEHRERMVHGSSRIRVVK